METASATLLEVTVTHFTFAVFLFFILGFQTICKISVGATYQSIHSEWLIHVALVTEWRRLLFLLNHFICFKDRKQSKGYFLRTQVSNPKPQGSFCLRTIWTNWNDLYNLRLLEISSWNYKTAGSCEVSWSRLFKGGGVLKRLNYPPGPNMNPLGVILLPTLGKITTWLCLLQKEKENHCNWKPGPLDLEGLKLSLTDCDRWNFKMALWVPPVSIHRFLQSPPLRVDKTCVWLLLSAEHSKGDGILFPCLCSFTWQRWRDSAGILRFQIRSGRPFKEGDTLCWPWRLSCHESQLQGDEFCQERHAFGRGLQASDHPGWHLCCCLVRPQQWAYLGSA